MKINNIVKQISELKNRISFCENDIQNSNITNTANLIQSNRTQAKLNIMLASYTTVGIIAIYFILK